MTQLSGPQLSNVPIGPGSIEQAQLGRPGLSRPGLSRHCAGCDEERLFEQFHAEPASCPDTADGDCPEWGCTICGEALIIGLPGPGYASDDRAVRAA
jgi:hypothetical protein